jgi:hypothetical protein
MNNLNIFNSRRDLQRLPITHLSQNIPQYLSTPSLRQSTHHYRYLIRSYRSYLFPHHFHQFYLYFIISLLVSISLQDYKTNRHFPFQTIFNPNHPTLHHQWMLIKDIFHLRSRQSMTSCINHIIQSTHYMHITIFIYITSISCCIIPIMLRKVSTLK